VHTEPKITHDCPELRLPTDAKDKPTTPYRANISSSALGEWEKELLSDAKVNHPTQTRTQLKIPTY
jgi:hypothetical protein